MSVTNTVSAGGCVTFWSVSDRTHHDGLSRGLMAIGLQTLAPAKRPHVAALRDALEDVVARGGKALINALDGKDGFAVVERSKDCDLAVGKGWGKVTFICRIDQSLNISFDPYDSRAQKIVDKFNEWLGYCQASAVGASLAAICTHLHGVRLRPNGGVYWLPESSLETWDRVAQSISDNGTNYSQVYRIRHHLDVASIVAVKDSLVNEASAIINAINKDVMDESLGDRALRHRQAQAVDLEGKLNLYEGILGVALDSIRHQAVEAGDAALRAAMIAASVKPAAA